MVNYIIRVSYPGAVNSDTFDRINVELAKFNVAGAIKADDEKGYYLPQGQYCYSGSETINEVRDAVFRLASSILAEPQVLVLEVTTLSWAGLKLVEGA